MGCDGHCCQGATVVIGFRQAHRLVLRVVVVAPVGLFDAHLGQAGLVEQMPGEFAAGAGKIAPFLRVPRQDCTRPEAGAENDTQHKQYQDHPEHVSSVP